MLIEDEEFYQHRENWSQNIKMFQAIANLVSSMANGSKHPIKNLKD